ncbi:sensor histidine kinase [Hamadaea tsunoensis]|uniref:sensor histidine kinase n=1 Tax=Hamadaea tsunoensis TaxID=53368 RepID=UPI0003F956A7|nr:HAMP domain-containing sensor histidine kinase [Hamadaea tsunoensis]
MIRRSLQVQLTLLYAVPFMITGALLLSVPLFGISNTSPANGLQPRPEVETGSDRVLGLTVAAYAVMVVVSLCLGWFIAGRFLRPLRRSIEAQQNFVANASHELRTPLTAERALLQVALSDPDADAATLRSVCEEVLELGRHQESLIAALMALADGERGTRLRVHLDVKETTARVLDRADPRGLTVDRRLEPGPVTGDPRQLESLITNLVENALRYNVPGGYVTVTTGQRDGKTVVTVVNSGPVVPPDQVKRLFEPFARLTGERLNTEGHGLGLAIVQAIADAHQARITARARPEGGLDVTVTF